jgi:hypothetical protein
MMTVISRDEPARELVFLTDDEDDRGKRPAPPHLRLVTDHATPRVALSNNRLLPRFDHVQLSTQSPTGAWGGQVG